MHANPRPELLAILGALLLFPTGALRADTWHVTYDPDQPEDRVGAVAAQASSEDVILIDPGIYYEHIPLEGKSLTFVGAGGPGATILDGSRALSDREGSIIYALTGDTGDLRLENLTLRNGTGVRVESIQNQYAGGAVYWSGAQDPATGSLALVDCSFENNVTGSRHNEWAIGGGAIMAGFLVSVSIDACTFSQNETTTRGGDLFLGPSGSTTITACDFAVGKGGYSGGVSVDYAGQGALTIERSVFHAEGPGYSTSTGLSIEARQCELLDNTFVDRGGVLATRVTIFCRICPEAHAASGGCNLGVTSEIEMSGNVFWNAAAADSAAPATLFLWWPGESVTMRGNTLARCGVEIWDSEGGASPLVFENNIIARGTAYFSIPQGGGYSCNSFWRSSVLDALGNLSNADNTSEDPRFCDEAAGDLTLSEGSPCAPSSTNEECGLIGAETVACDLGIFACCVGQGCQLVTEQECSDLGGRWMIDPPYTSCDPNPCISPVVETSWGAIKAMFREKD